MNIEILDDEAQIIADDFDKALVAGGGRPYFWLLSDEEKMSVIAVGLMGAYKIGNQMHGNIWNTRSSGNAAEAVLATLR